MQVFVKPFTGNTITLDLGAAVTVEDMKAKLLAQEGIPLEQQWLSFGGKRLENGHTLHEYGIQQDSIIHLIQLLM